MRCLRKLSTQILVQIQHLRFMVCLLMVAMRLMLIAYLFAYILVFNRLARMAVMVVNLFL